MVSNGKSDDVNFGADSCVCGSAHASGCVGALRQLFDFNLD